MLTQKWIEIVTFIQNTKSQYSVSLAVWLGDSPVFSRIPPPLFSSLDIFGMEWPWWIVCHYEAYFPGNLGKDQIINVFHAMQRNLEYLDDGKTLQDFNPEQWRRHIYVVLGN